YLDFATSPGAANSCFVSYVPATNTLYLLTDDNTATVAGSITPGSGGSLSNHQCTISGTGGSVTSGGNNLTVPVNVTFSSTFTGSKNIYALAQNIAGSRSAWQTLGTWTAGTSAAPLSAVSVSPNSGGSSGAQTFNAV